MSVTFDDVRQLALALPEVEEGTSYGTPAFKVKGKFLSRLKEDGETLVVRIDMDERDVLMAANPETFYITDHYRGYPAMLAHHLNLIETVAQEADEFDVVHFHLDYLPFSQIRRLEIPAVTTLHGRLDIPDLYPLFREFDDMRLISISDAQRAPMPWASWLAAG